MIMLDAVGGVVALVPYLIIILIIYSVEFE